MFLNVTSVVKKAIFSFVLSACLAIPAHSAEYNMLINGKRYEISEGVPLKAVTPKGEVIEIILTKKTILKFDKHGISFDYNSEIRVTTEAGLGVVTVTAESEASPLLMIQIYSVGTTPNAVVDDLTHSLRNEFQGRGARFFEGSGSQVEEKVNGVMRGGRKLEFMIAGQRMTSKIVAFKKGHSTILVMYQYDHEDKDMADRCFGSILTSLK